MFYAYCSAPGCKHIVAFGPDPIEKLNPRFFPAPKFCEKCGAPMISKCPSCGTYRESLSASHCPDCGKAYK
ncbi:zinc ribbon domain-containing protein [uncultured Oscillibacter sp.]|uniref:zinc ribbon domain-containing protein n=1 Tax=uncultured Oscillibacter sp. TaxID=876091 RepID=UPI0034546C63